MMKIVIFGAGGFLGKALARFYIKKKAEVHLISSREVRIEGCHFHKWDGKTIDLWKNTLEDSDAVINMAGIPVNYMCYSQNKEQIQLSRIDSTKVISEAILKCQHPPKLWINSSSVAIYKHAEDIPQDEPTGILGNDFSSKVCKKWEDLLFSSNTPSTLKYAIRTSLVFSNNGGILPLLTQLTQLGLGGKHGNEKHKVSWVHITDFLNAIDFLITRKVPEGIYNICAPNPTDNETLLKYLKKKTDGPAKIQAPKWVLEMSAWLLGTETELLLKSRWVIPTKLLNAGFVFQKNRIEEI